MENKEKPSMFAEFEKTLEQFKVLSEKYGDEAMKHTLPAMIVLERKEWGENKHAMIGQPSDIFILFEWGIRLISDGYDIPFDRCLKAIEEVHKNSDPIYLSDYKGEI